MNNEILVSAERLNELIQAESCVVVDCRFDFGNKNKGRSQWAHAHIPGASYAHLDEDLAAPVNDDTGRHPLPDAGVFAAFLASIGWSPGKLLVAYDDGSNAISVRLWWLMRYFGHAAAVLDGGLAAWTAARYPLEPGEASPTPAPLGELVPADQMTVSSEEIQASLDSGDLTIVDARASERFSGQVEPLDTRGGHIPGALNRPFHGNLDKSGCFKPADVLRSEFSDLLRSSGSTGVVHSCGSGVTACHNIFAMELAGMSATLLYPGSWSEWIRDPGRPVETGS
jgi:thiosulfate/3-mercaptopyruvate sulfurtransferase